MRRPRRRSEQSQKDLILMARIFFVIGLSFLIIGSTILLYTATVDYREVHRQPRRLPPPY